MFRAYVYIAISFFLALIGTFVNYGLVVYGIYGQLIGFSIELLLIVVLVYGIFYSFFRVSKLPRVKMKIIHGIVVFLLTLCAAWLIVDGHIPAATKMYNGTLSCPTCP